MFNEKVGRKERGKANKKKACMWRQEDENREFKTGSWASDMLLDSEEDQEDGELR